MTFLMSVWHMAGWGDELGESLVSRRLLDMPVLLYRKTDGSPAAMVDRCPHRFVPLSRGERQGDAIACSYHGPTFGPDGSCIHNPFSSELPKGARIRTFLGIDAGGTRTRRFIQQLIANEKAAS